MTLPETGEKIAVITERSGKSTMFTSGFIVSLVEVFMAYLALILLVRILRSLGMSEMYFFSNHNIGFLGLPGTRK